jgi:hypothetical protein
MGMGVVFREVKPVFQAILEDWLQQSLKAQNGHQRRSQGETIGNAAQAASQTIGL